MALLIPIPRSNHNALVQALNRVAPFDWDSRQTIHVYPLEEGSAREFAQGLCEYCQNNKIHHVLVPKRVHCGEKDLAEAGFSVTIGPTVVELVRGQGLLRHLRDLGLDWRSQVSSRLKHYALGTVGETEIDRWLGQFERLGNHRKVGEHLLQLLDILPMQELGEALSTDSDFYGADLVVGFNNDKWGKSWGTVSTLIRKKCGTADLLPITEAIEKSTPPKVLRLVEDGLFSGTEMRAIFDSLRGIRPDGRSQKVPKLSNPEVLSQVAAQVYFGVVSDYGEAVVRRYMVSNALPNVQVTVSSAARKVRVLSEGRTADVTNTTDEEQFRTQLRARIKPFSFQDDKGWKDPAAQLRAKEFCEKVGEQLWRSYIMQKGFDLKSWPDDRIRRCALGMDGLGLAFAFPHSVPKATLPVLWARGKVSFNGASIDWIPLLPNADT